MERQIQRRLVVSALGVILLALAAWDTWAPVHAPSGQPPMTVLTAENFKQFQNDFNEAPQEVRLLLLLSPT
jgi:hypothetical protein